MKDFLKTNFLLLESKKKESPGDFHGEVVPLRRHDFDFETIFQPWLDVLKRRPPTIQRWNTCWEAADKQRMLTEAATAKQSSRNMTFIGCLLWHGHCGDETECI